MRRVDQIQVTMIDEQGILERIFFYSSSQPNIDEFFSFLVNEGAYDDIQITKRFTVSKEVMSRLKGK